MPTYLNGFEKPNHAVLVNDCFSRLNHVETLSPNRNEGNRAESKFIWNPDAGVVNGEIADITRNKQAVA
jgi:hypothetical protein